MLKEKDYTKIDVVSTILNCPFLNYFSCLEKTESSELFWYQINPLHYISYMITEILKERIKTKFLDWFGKICFRKLQNKAKARSNGIHLWNAKLLAASQERFWCTNSLKMYPSTWKIEKIMTNKQRYLLVATATPWSDRRGARREWN